MERWEVAARELVRDTLASYNHAGDRFRLADLAACFAEDGVLEIRDGGTAVGREAIVAMLTGAKRDPVVSEAPVKIRHFVSNVLFSDVVRDHLRTDEYFQVLTQHGLDHWGRYRDQWSLTDEGWRLARRLVIVDGMVPGGWYADHAPVSTSPTPTSHQQPEEWPA